MKRSSSKLISKAGSVRNINKLAYKFSFELHIESVDKMMGSSDVVVTWERGPKVLSTKPAKIDKSSRVAHFGGEVLAQEVTLFKKKKEGSNFEDKVFRLSVRQNSERGKVVGKIEIDFSDYVEIPSFSKRVGASLSSGGRIVMRVMSSYMGEAKPRRSSRGTASVGSRDPESDGQSSAAPDEDERSEMDADFNDLDDLDIDEAPLVVPLPPQATPQQASKKPGSIRGRTRPPNPTAADEPAANGKFRRRPSAPSPNRDPSFESSSGSVGSLRTARSKGDVDVGATNAAGPSRAEFEKLRRENRALRRQNEDLLQRKEELERKMDERGHDENAESLEQLMVENTSLRRDVGDLEAKLAREPVYADVVRDLREAKMALAILTLEKDELTQEVRKLRRR